MNMEFIPGKFYRFTCAHFSKPAFKTYDHTMEWFPDGVFVALQAEDEDHNVKVLLRDGRVGYFTLNRENYPPGIEKVDYPG